MKTVGHKTIGKRIVRRYFERQNKMERTDAFTFPYNIQFQDSVKAHLRYENDLHKNLTIKFPTECRPKNGICECARAELFDHFTKTHLEYIEKRKGTENDLNYIKKVSGTNMASIMERGETHE